MRIGSKKAKRYFIRAPIIVAVLVATILLYSGKVTSNILFDEARLIFSDVGHIKNWSVEVKNNSEGNKHYASVEYYGNEKLEKFIISENGNEVTNVILDYSSGRLYVRLDSLVERGLDYKIKNMGTKWNGQKWIPKEDYLILDVRQMVKKAKDSGDSKEWDKIMNKIPKIKSLAYGGNEPAYSLRSSKADDIMYLYPDTIIYILKDSISRKFIYRTGLTENVWHIKASGNKDVKDFITNTIANAKKSDSESVDMMLKMLSEAKEEKVDAKQVVEDIQKNLGVDLSKLGENTTSGNDDTKLNVSLTYKGGIGQLNIVLDKYYRDNDERRKVDNFSINVTARKATRVEIKAPEYEDCLTCESLADFQQVADYLQLSNIMQLLINNNESEDMTK